MTPRGKRPIQRGPVGRDVLGAQRRSEVLALRIKGTSFRAIGEALGIDPTTAHEHWKNGMAELRAAAAESAEHIFALENERLDALHAAFWDQAIAGDEKAAAVVLKVLERRAKVHGLDAPTKHVVAVGEIDPTRVAALTDEELERGRRGDPEIIGRLLKAKEDSE